MELNTIDLFRSTLQSDPNINYIQKVFNNYTHKTIHRDIIKTHIHTIVDEALHDPVREMTYDLINRQVIHTLLTEFYYFNLNSERLNRISEDYLKYTDFYRQYDVNSFQLNRHREQRMEFYTP
uniref:Uncharacterized protein n=1 Tax=viral metagenome TaxID=1070528 RepID=A0A6C0J858_9ZZZZ